MIGLCIPMLDGDGSGCTATNPEAARQRRLGGAAELAETKVHVGAFNWAR